MISSTIYKNNPTNSELLNGRALPLFLLFCGLLILFLYMTGCNCDCDCEEYNIPDSTANSSDDAFVNVDDDLRNQSYPILYAKHFQITETQFGKLVKVTVPFSSQPFVYHLIERGVALPDEQQGVTIIQTPVRSIVCMATAHLTNINRLHLLDRLIGFSEFKYINTPEILAKIQAGKLKEVGSGPSTNVEVLLDLNPELVLTDGIGSQQYDNLPVLQETGLHTVMAADHYENTPLARAEWIKFIALFFNREAEADQIFQKIESQYLDLVKLAARKIKKPTVLLNTSFQGTWYIPGGNTYMAHFLKDAGADYIWKDEPSSVTIPISSEAAFEKGTSADFWLNPGQSKTLQEMLSIDNRYKMFDAVKNCRVYNSTRRMNKAGGNDFWETGIANPHLILSDLIKIFHPDLLPDHELIWYRKLNCLDK